VSYSWAANGKSGFGCTNMNTKLPITSYDDVKLIIKELERTVVIEGVTMGGFVVLNIQRFPI
jgi:hypothetical protein